MARWVVGRWVRRFQASGPSSLGCVGAFARGVPLELLFALGVAFAVVLGVVPVAGPLVLGSRFGPGVPRWLLFGPPLWLLFPWCSDRWWVPWFARPFVSEAVLPVGGGRLVGCCGAVAVDVEVVASEVGVYEDLFHSVVECCHILVLTRDELVGHVFPTLVFHVS